MVKATIATLVLLLVPLSAQAGRGAEVFFGPRLGAGMVAQPTDGATELSLSTQLGVQADAHWDTGASMDFVLDGQLLVGGIEQGALYPSLATLVGIATKSGFQVAVGPHLSTGEQPLGMAISVGQEIAVGDGKLPIDLLVVPTADAITVTALFGYYFSTRHW
jgi:hypothetical protein